MTIDTFDSAPQFTPGHGGDQIEAYLAGGLSADDRLAFESHVAGCDICNRALTAASEVDARLLKLFAADRPNAGFEDRTAAEFWASTHPKQSRGRIRLHPAVRMVATRAAAVIALGAIGYVSSTALRQGRLQPPSDERLASLSDWLPFQSHSPRSNTSNVSLVEGLSANQGQIGPTTQPGFAETGIHHPFIGSSAQYHNSNETLTEKMITGLVGGLVPPMPLARDSGGAAPNPRHGSDASGFSNGDLGRYSPPVITGKIGGSGSQTTILTSGGVLDAVSPPVAITAGTLNVTGNGSASNLAITGLTQNALSFGGTVQPIGGKTAASNAFFYDQNGDTGVVSGNIGGRGTLTLGGVNTYSGGTTVTGGITKTGGGTLALNGGGTLTVSNGTLSPPADDGRAAGGDAKGKSAPGFSSDTFSREQSEAMTHGFNPGSQVAVTNAPDFTDSPKFDLSAGSGGAGSGGAGGGGLFRGKDGPGAARQPAVAAAGDVGEAAPTGAPAAPPATPASPPAETTATVPPAIAQEGKIVTNGESGQAAQKLADKQSAAIKELQDQAAAASSASVTVIPEPTLRVVAGGTPPQEIANATKVVAQSINADSESAKPASETPPPSEKAVVQKEFPALQSKLGDPEGGAKPVAATSSPETAQPPAPPPATPPATPAAVAPTPQPQSERHIIRNGELTFEVDSFDSSMMQISKISAEEGAFVATTDSEKLPNGHVRGVVIVRCPPERLDTLVLKLRGIGDLKGQKITAQDITKQYTDIESRLRAAHATEKRYLDIIQQGKGQIKDIVEAEKQHAMALEKVESLEGEIRYYNSLVSLATLSITLAERDIKLAYATSQTERVSMSMTTDDVEKSRADVLNLIEQAKGRVIDATLKKEKGGEYSAVISATVKAEGADIVIDQIKQVGKVSRFDRERLETSEGGTAAPPPGAHIDRRDTVLQISMFNLADVTPRSITNLSLVADDVEKSYNSIIEQVKAGGGRIVSSQLLRPKAGEIAGSIAFQTPSEKADLVLAAVRAGVEVTRMDVKENEDKLELTDAKKGFVVTIASMANIEPREHDTLQVAVKDVPGAFSKILDAARLAGSRITTSQLAEQDAANVNGQIECDVPRDKLAQVESAMSSTGQTIKRNVARSVESENTVDTKVRLSITVFDEIRLRPRDTIGRSVAARNVPDAFNKLTDALRDAGAHVIVSQVADQDKPTVNGQLQFIVTRENAPRVEAALGAAGETVGRNMVRQPDTQDAVDTKVFYQISVVDQRQIEPREKIAEAVFVRDVPGRYQTILNALHDADAQVRVSQLNQQNREAISATIDFVVRRDAADSKDQSMIEKLIGDSADIFGRNLMRSADPNTLDSKVGYTISLQDADTQKARESYVLDIEVTDIDRSLADLEAAAVAAGGRAVDSTPVTGKDERGETVGRIVMDVPLSRAGEVITSARDKGHVTTTRRSRDDQVPEGSLSRARIEITVGNGAIMAGDTGLWSTIKAGLRTSGIGLLTSLEYIIIGLCLIGPWAGLLWILWRLSRRNRATAAKSPAPVAT